MKTLARRWFNLYVNLIFPTGAGENILQKWGIPTCKKQIDAYQQYGSSVIAVEQIIKEDIGKYGIIEPKQIDKKVYEVLSLVEKPEPSEVSSQLGIVGRYILPPPDIRYFEVHTTG